MYKKIGNKKYPYLQWRNGEKILSKYIKEDEIEEIEKNQLRRRELKDEIKRINEDIKKLEKVLNYV